MWAEYEQYRTIGTREGRGRLHGTVWFTAFAVRRGVRCRTDECRTSGLKGADPGGPWSGAVGQRPEDREVARSYDHILEPFGRCKAQTDAAWLPPNADALAKLHRFARYHYLFLLYLFHASHLSAYPALYVWHFDSRDALCGALRGRGGTRLGALVLSGNRGLGDAEAEALGEALGGGGQPGEERAEGQGGQGEGEVLPALTHLDLQATRVGRGRWAGAYVWSQCMSSSAARFVAKEQAHRQTCLLHNLGGSGWSVGHQTRNEAVHSSMA